MNIEPVAYIRTGFPEKFGIPRQSGLADIVSQIEFEKEFRDIGKAKPETTQEKPGGNET